MLHDYPPITGGGIATASQELARIVGNRCHCRILSARAVDHFADDRVRAKSWGWRSAASNILTADVLIVHWTFSVRRLATVSLLVGPMLRKPTLCVVHTSPAHADYNRLSTLPRPVRRLVLMAVARLLAHSTRVIALSPGHRRALDAIGFPTTDCAPLPVRPTPRLDRAYISRSPSRRPVQSIAVVGELSRLKGTDRLPQLLSELTPEFKFRIVGGGPLGAWLASCVAQLPVVQRDRVVMEAAVRPDDMADVYEAVDAVIITSRTESQCRVVSEAMLAGAIVLAPRVEGAGELVIDDVTGIRIDPSDPIGVRARLARLNRESERASLLRANARRSAERAFTSSLLEWEALLAPIVGSHDRF